MYPTNNVLPTVVPVQPPPPPAMSHLKAELAPPVTSLLVTESVLPTASNGTIDLGIIGADETEPGIGICGWLLTMISWGIVMVTLPFSLFVCFKVVQEYERAVIFRLGRLLHGGSRGPGLFFVLPCIENYQKVDLRTITLDVPPQEVKVFQVLC